MKIILIGLVALLLLGGGIFYFVQKKSATSPTQNGGSNLTKSSEKEKGNTIKGTITDLLARGENMTCRFSSSKDGSSIEGVVYVSGKNSRSDITAINEDGVKMETHAIIKDEWMYMWSSDRKEGMKLTVENSLTEPVLEEPVEEDDPAQAAIDANAVMDELDYDCSSWPVDQSKLEVPSDITFVDLTKQLEGLQDQLRSACDLCSSQGDADAVAQCRKSLNCK